MLTFYGAEDLEAWKEDLGIEEEVIVTYELVVDLFVGLFVVVFVEEKDVIVDRGGGEDIKTQGHVMTGFELHYHRGDQDVDAKGNDYCLLKMVSSAPNPSHNSNFSLLSVLGRERLTGLNYMDWMRNLRFTLRYENKEYVLNVQIPTINDDSTQEEIEAHQKHYDDANKVSCIMASSMSPEFSSCVDCWSQCKEKKDFSFHLSDRGSKRKFESEIAPAGDLKEAVCFYCNTKGHWNDLKESRKLKHGELNLVMGNRKITPVTKIGKYELMLKYENGDILVLFKWLFYFKNFSLQMAFYETVECIDNGNVILNVGSSNELDKSKLWQSRLGHVNKKRIAQLQNDGVLESFDFKSDDVCESCLLGKMTKSPFIGTCKRCEGLLDLVHTDVCGPFRSATKDGKHYYVTFTDDFSRYGYVYLIKHKSATLEVFKRYQNEVENQLGRKIKVLRSDRGREYLSIEFFDHLKNYGIVSQLTPPRTSQLNETVAHILNLVPTKKVLKTPFEMWKGKRPSFGHIKIWGCEVFVRREAQDKLEARSEKFLFITYPEESFGYLFYKPTDDVFADKEPIVNIDTQQEVVTPVEPDDISLPIRRTSSRVRKPPQFYYGFYIEEENISDSTLSELDKPANYKETMASLEAAK
ncbi:retrotransposon protein, putative, ty1-copia subclass [Tanacetum coccineum]